MSGYSLIASTVTNQHKDNNHSEDGQSFVSDITDQDQYRIDYKF